MVDTRHENPTGQEYTPSQILHYFKNGDIDLTQALDIVNAQGLYDPIPFLQGEIDPNSIWMQRNILHITNTRSDLHTVELATLKLLISERGIPNGYRPVGSICTVNVKNLISTRLFPDPNTQRRIDSNRSTIQLIEKIELFEDQEACSRILGLDKSIDPDELFTRLRTYRELLRTQEETRSELLSDVETTKENMTPHELLTVFQHLEQDPSEELLNARGYFTRFISQDPVIGLLIDPGYFPSGIPKKS